MEKHPALAFSLGPPALLYQFTFVKYGCLNSGTSAFIQEAPSDPAPSFFAHSLASAVFFFATTTSEPSSSEAGDGLA